MKRNFYAVLIASLFTIAASAQCLLGWGYYQPITINNSLAQPLTDFQVKLTVNTAVPIAAGHMDANGNDIRFQLGNCAEVNYWIESGINTATTVIWVKVPLLVASGNTTVNMYYGNPAAVAESNGDSVFLFFDDFNDGVFNTTKWTTRGTPAVLQESGGILEMQGNSNWEYIRSNTTWNIPVIIETNESTTQPSAGLVLGYAATDHRYTFRANGANKGVTVDPDVSGGNAWHNLSYPAVPHATYPGMNIYELQTDLVSNTIMVNSFANVSTGNVNTTPLALNAATGTGYYVGFSTYSVGHIEYVDWIKVRSFAAQQPVSTIGSELVNEGILTSALSFSAVCAGTTQTISFNANGTFNPGNIFSAELSDASGSFAAPVVIGTLASTATGSQSMSVVIPAAAVGAQYRIRVSSSNTAMTGADNGSDIVINAAPVVSVVATDLSICAGEQDTLIASGAMTYAWNTGPATDSLFVAPVSSTSYIVTGADMNGCAASDTISINVDPLPVLTVSGDTLLCAGQTDSLWVSGASAYEWSTMETTSGIEITPASTTTYSVTGTDMNGCSSQSMITVTVSPLPSLSLSAPSDTLCGADGMMTLNASPAGGTWSGPGVTGSMFDPPSAPVGSNSVVYMYTDSLGCSASDSLSLYVDICLDVQNLNANAVLLYPNPNNGTFTIQSDASIGTIEITDALGRVVYTNTVQSTQATIALDGFADGIYVLRTKDGVVRFVIGR